MTCIWLRSENLKRKIKSLLIPAQNNVTVIPIIIGAIRTVLKDLIKGLEELEIGGRAETIQTIALQRLAKILKRIRETWGDMVSIMSEKNK